MNKRRLHHLWKSLRLVKPWYFLVLAVICGGVFVLALRSNYEHMVKLRDAVYAADKDNGDVEGTLQNLRSYVYAHMNTNLSNGNTSIYPPIQLKYTYERLSQQAVQASSNEQLYTEAQAYCQQQNSTDFSGRNRVPCIEDYVTKHGAPKAAAVPVNLYQFDFVSPTWSPDLAGWSLVAAILSVILFVGLWAVERVIRKRLD
jgi:preprotein translocase subunit SecF